MPPPARTMAAFGEIKQSTVAPVFPIMLAGAEPMAVPVLAALLTVGKRLAAIGFLLGSQEPAKHVTARTTPPRPPVLPGPT